MVQRDFGRQEIAWQLVGLVDCEPNKQALHLRRRMVGTNDQNAPRPRSPDSKSPDRIRR
jgi:hypothetical protein